MHERIPITATAPWAISSVDGSGPISHTDVAKEIWQVLRRKAAGERDIPPLGLVVQGGGMRGVYSMAVLAAFEEMGWTPCFDHVAGASAGAMNGAHFITGQAGYGVETYIDYLSNRKFIDFFRLTKLVDLDYMIDDLVRHVRPFNLPALLEASTELHIALVSPLRLETVQNGDRWSYRIIGTGSYLPLLENPAEALLPSAGVPNGIRTRVAGLKGRRPRPG